MEQQSLKLVNIVLKRPINIDEVDIQRIVLYSKH